MSIQVQWEDRIIRYAFADEWTWDDFAGATHRAFQLMRKSKREVHIILDMTTSNVFPVGALDGMRQMLANAPINLGIIAVASSSEMAAYTFKMLANVDPRFGERVVLEYDLESAYAVLDEYDGTMGV